MKLFNFAENTNNGIYEINIKLELKELRRNTNVYNSIVFKDAFLMSAKEQFGNFQHSCYPNDRLNILTQEESQIIIVAQTKAFIEQIGDVLTKLEDKSTEIYENELQNIFNLELSDLKNVLDKYFSYELLKFQLNQPQSTIYKRPKI